MGMGKECCEYHADFELKINKKYDVLLDATSRHSKKTDLLSENLAELRNALIGTVEKKGILHEMNDIAKEMRIHIEESEKYRPIIEENSRVCKRVSNGINLTLSTIITTISRVAILAVIGLFAWDKFKG